MAAHGTVADPLARQTDLDPDRVAWRYLRLLAASACASFALIWLWVACMPMAFMEPEYASWQAKLSLLDRCDIGDVLIVGDSRPAADILPARLAAAATNLAVGGGEPIEAYVTLVRALRCRVQPRLVIISFDPGHFVRPDLFWERSVRFGLLRATEIDELRARSQAAADMSVYGGHEPQALPTSLRDALYRIRFPTLYFASLVHGGGGLRWWRNQDRLNATVATRGQYTFGSAAGSDAVAIEGHLTTFRALPILDQYFDRILRLLADRGIEARFIAMPVNETTWQHVLPAVRHGFEAYLWSYEHRYPLFHVDGDIMPHWPDRWFGDQFCHLNPPGTERFSALLAQRLLAAPPRS